MRRDERGVGQQALPGAADLDQVVAVGAIAVQEHHQPLGLSARRLEPRTIEFNSHGVQRPFAFAFFFFTGIVVTTMVCGVTGAPSRRFTA